VHLLEDEPAAGAENGHLLAHVPADFVGGGVRQDAAGVAAAAPEREPVAEVPLEPRASMPAQEICTGLVVSSPASIRSGINGRIPPQQCSITLTSASSLARRHIRRVAA